MPRCGPALPYTRVPARTLASLPVQDLLDESVVVVVAKPLCRANERDTDRVDLAPQLLQVSGLIRI